MARNLRDKLNRVHGIGVVRHADVRSSGGLPAGAADGEPAPAGWAACCLHGDPDQQRGRAAPSRALLRPGSQRGGHGGADHRQLHRPRRAPHGGGPDPGVGRPDGRRRLRSPGAAACRPAHRSCEDRRHGRFQGRAWRRSMPPSPCASAGAMEFPHLFDLHVAICPGATAQHRDATTHGRPMFFMLAARDDYTPAPLAVEYAERMRAAGNDRIKVKVYGSAHHGWESIGPVFDIKDAENWSCCRNFIEDDGTHFIPAAGRAMSEPEYQAWARQHCVTRGRAGGRRHARAASACDGGFAGLPARPRLRASMDESGVSGYIYCVIRVRFLAGLLAFVVSVLGSVPSFANETLWVGSTAAKVRAEALLKAIRGASDHGLDPAWYGVGEVEKALAPGADPAATETLLTAAFVAYASDVSTGPGARQSHRQGHRHPPAQGRARRPPESGDRGPGFRGLSRRLAAQGRLSGAAEGARGVARQARQGQLHAAARRHRAEARHDRSARAGPAQAPGRTRSRRSRAGRRWPISTTSRWRPW